MISLEKRNRTKTVKPCTLTFVYIRTTPKKAMGSLILVAYVCVTKNQEVFLIILTDNIFKTVGIIISVIVQVTYDIEC